MFGTKVLGLFFLLAPAGVLWLCRKIELIGKIGPVLVLYILGIIIGNIFKPQGMAQLQDVLTSAAIPFAIPLMLFACRFSRSRTRSQFLALFTGLVAVSAAVVAGYFIFGKDLEEGPKIGGMLTGVYTGGTVNMAALKTMLGVSEETFVILNSYDMIISFIYLTFLMTIGVKLFRRWLPNEGSDNDEVAIRQALEESGRNPYKGLFTKQGLKEAGTLLLIDVAIIGISAGLGLLAGDNWFMTVLILALTTLGIAASFNKKIRNLRFSYDIGMYAIYIFSIVVASMADLSELDVKGGLSMLAYLSFIIFGSLILQVIMAKLFKIDSDTMVISSVTYICSPPFVPMMAASMKNRLVLASGLAIGVVGYAVGTYLGFFMSRLLQLL